MVSEDKNCQRQEPCVERHLRFSTPNFHQCGLILNNMFTGKSDPYLRVSQDNVPLHTTATVSLLAPTGALIVTVVYYIYIDPRRPLFENVEHFCQYI